MPAAPDWAQLSPVEAGGAFHLLVRDRDLAPELADVRRFTRAWEKAASIDLRVGRPEAVDAYQDQDQDRVAGGDRESMLDLMYDGWRADVAAGRRSLMIDSDKDTVAALNERARAHRVAAGQVHARGIQMVSGAVIGVGDLVVTRENNRLLSCGRGWVKNGDQWLVQEVAADGAVTVARTMGAGMPGGRRIVLPADYARQHVELGVRDDGAPGCRLSRSRVCAIRRPTARCWRRCGKLRRWVWTCSRVCRGSSAGRPSRTPWPARSTYGPR